MTDTVDKQFLDHSNARLICSPTYQGKNDLSRLGFRFYRCSNAAAVRAYQQPRSISAIFRVRLNTPGFGPMLAD
jgi:hypothetical protein